MASGEYMRVQPEKAGVIKLFKFLFIDSNLSHYDFVETDVTTKQKMKVSTKQETSFSNRLLIVGTLVYIKFTLIWRSLTGSAVKSRRGNADYLSFGNIIDRPIVLAIKASDLAYEDAASIQNVVNNQWKKQFLEFFDCSNNYLKGPATQAFVFCDKATDPNWIVVAFRGTEHCNDWATNFEFSLIGTDVMGKVHVGFLKALGLQDDQNFAKGFPADYSGSETLAYYSIRALLVELVAKYSNAKIRVTGHSLGGALAVLFTSLLAYHGRRDILDKVEYVKTFGQPRIGDAEFGKYMASVLGDRYRRMVYRFDLVPRVPFDFMEFEHFGTCIQYEGWFKGKTVTEEPNKNYFDRHYLRQIYWGYLVDFARTIWWGIRKCKWEGWRGTFYRIACVFLPGAVFHNCSNYIYAAVYADVTYKFMA